MQVFEVVGDLFKELSIHRQQTEKDNLYRDKALRSLADKYLGAMYECYNILLEVDSVEAMYARFLGSDNIWKGEELFVGAPLQRDSYRVGTSRICGKSYQEIFDRRAEMALSVFRKIVYQEQLIEDGKLLEASLNRFSFLTAVVELNLS